MSSARARANHGLYLAKLLLSGWQRAIADQDVPALTLDQAYLPAVRDHLLTAYGWFLLHLSGLEPSPGGPPRSCSELPAVAAGKAVSGELREFAHLESDGWLAALVEVPEAPAAGGRIQGLARETSESPGIDEVQLWLHHLEELFERMSDSLDEC